MQDLDKAQQQSVRKAEQIHRDVQDNFEKQIGNVRMENMQLKETLREFTSFQNQQRMQSFGQQQHVMEDQEENDEEELINHFQNFDMAELGDQERSRIQEIMMRSATKMSTGKQDKLIDENLLNIE